MIKEERQKMIVDLIKDQEFFDTEDIARRLNIPLTTLRRDLNDLARQEKVERLHGGVKNISSNFAIENFIQEKITENIDEKRIVATKALELIKTGESIFLDSGSTTYFLASMLDAKLDLHIVTNSILHAQVLINRGHQNIYLLGGKVNINLDSITGYQAIKSLESYHFDKAFLGVNAVSFNGDFYTTSDEQAQLKTSVIEHSNQSYGLCISEKLNSQSFCKFSTKELCHLITN